jgi:hypothetical protein
LLLNRSSVVLGRFVSHPAAPPVSQFSPELIPRSSHYVVATLPGLFDTKIGVSFEHSGDFLRALQGGLGALPASGA